MFENHRDDERRGQVGIGTLIVFIAMVLVAAIAAGVLVNTAGFLQSTAEDTGEESVDKVTNRVEVVSAVGTYNNAGDAINFTNMTVRKAPGSGDVDLEDATITYLSEDTATTLLVNNTGADGSTANVSKIKDNDDSLMVMNDNGDRFDIGLDVSAIEPDDGLEPSETVELEVTTKTGDTTIYVFTTPDSYSGYEDGAPVGL